MAETPDFAAEGLLEGLEDEEREARLELLGQLHEAGVALEDLRQAVREERLVLLPVELELGIGGERYTLAELAERSGLSAEFLVTQRLALGLPRARTPEARLHRRSTSTPRSARRCSSRRASRPRRCSRRRA